MMYIIMKYQTPERQDKISRKKKKNSQSNNRTQKREFRKKMSYII